MVLKHTQAAEAADDADRCVRLPADAARQRQPRRRERRHGRAHHAAGRALRVRQAPKDLVDGLCPAQRAAIDAEIDAFLDASPFVLPPTGASRGGARGRRERGETALGRWGGAPAACFL